MEVLVNGNGRPGLAENVRVLMAQGKNTMTLLECVKKSTDTLLQDRVIDDARREGSRRAIAQIRYIAILMLALLGLDLTVGLRSLGQLFLGE